MRNLGREMGMVDDKALFGLGSKIEVIGQDEEPMFKAEWTGPEIVAYQKGSSGIPVGATTILLADAMFIGVLGLGLGLGAALIKRIWTE